MRYFVYYRSAFSRRIYFGVEVFLRTIGLSGNFIRDGRLFALVCVITYHLVVIYPRSDDFISIAIILYSAALINWQSGEFGRRGMYRFKMLKGDNVANLPFYGSFLRCRVRMLCRRWIFLVSGVSRCVRRSIFV